MNDEIEKENKPDENRLNSFINNYEKELNETGKHTSLDLNPDSVPDTDEIETKEVDPNKGDQQKPVDNKKSLSKLIKPKFAVNILNLILPSLLVFILSRFSYYIDKKKMKLDDDEKEMLQPFVEDFLETIQLNFDNPYTNLAVGISIVWGIKIVDVLPEIKKEAPKPKKESDIVKFEIEYNENLERIKKDYKKKTSYSARKYFADSEPQRLNELLDKYGIVDERDNYINPKMN